MGTAFGILQSYHRVEIDFADQMFVLGSDIFKIHFLFCMEIFNKTEKALKNIA